jgi:MFS family permease
MTIVIVSAAQTGLVPQGRVRLFPLYLLAFTGDFLLSTMIVASTLVGTSQHVDGWVIGVLGSAFYMSYTPSALFLGKVSDRIGRRRSIMVCSVGFLGVSFLFMAGARSVVAVFIGELVVGFFNGFYWTSIEAFISEHSASETEHQANVNKFCLSWSIGYMIGPFLAPVLDDYDPVYSFLILAVLSSVNITNALFFVPRGSQAPPPPRTGVPSEKARGENKDVNGTMTVVLVLTLAIFVYNLARAFIVGVFPDIAKNAEYFGWTGVETGIVLFAFGAARSVTFMVQNRIKNDALLSRALLVMALSLCSFLFIITRDLVVFCLLFAVVGMFSALAYSMILQKMLHLPAGRGRSAGMFESGLSLGGLVAPIFSGIALGFFHAYEAAFIVIGLVSSVVSLVAVLVALYVRRK